MFVDKKHIYIYIYLYIYIYICYQTVQHLTISSSLNSGTFAYCPCSVLALICAMCCMKLDLFGQVELPSTP